MLGKHSTSWVFCYKEPKEYLPSKYLQPILPFCFCVCFCLKDEIMSATEKPQKMVAWSDGTHLKSSPGEMWLEASLS